MPTLIVENVPVEVYERLRQRDAAGRRSLPEEMLHLLEQLLREDTKPSARLPEFVASEEIPASCDLPRSSQPVPVAASGGQPRLPDPYAGEAPE